MADPMMRHLTTAQRHVALDRSDEYLAAWSAAREAVEAVGGHAWIFRGSYHEDRFLEFVEWTDPAPSPHTHGTVADAMAELDAFALAAHVEEWEEAT